MDNRPDKDLQQWQNRLLPLMVKMVVGLTLFFFIVTLVQLVYLHVNIKETPEASSEISLAIKDIDAKQLQMFVLEKYVIDKRYHQANVLLMSRVWTRYVGFITGMILAMVGAVFILGRLHGPVSELNGESSKIISFSIKSASPGIVLVFLGVVLMMVTIITHHEIEVTDKNTYTGNVNRPQGLDFTKEQ